MLLKTRDTPPPDQLTNTFVALRPPWPRAEKFYADATPVLKDARIVGNRRPFFILHMTLFSIGSFMGRLPDEALQKIDHAFNMVAYPAFEVVLDEARSFDTRKDSVPFVLEGAELAEVAGLRLATIGAAHIRDFSVPVRSSFSPHMTLAYARHRAPRMKVAPFCWRACEFQLIESWVGMAKCVELGHWSLWDNDYSKDEWRSIGDLTRKWR